MSIKRFIGTVLTLSLAGCATVQQSDFERMQAEADKVPDTQGTGPYPALTELDPNLEGYVVYRPRDLSPFREGTLGVFVWGNGACAADATSARQQLAEIASHGYLAIAPGQWRSGPNAKSPRPASGTGNGPFATETTATDLAYALDWAISENGRAGSRYVGMIDPNAIALGGYSCGGVQALRLADDPRIDTLVIQNSGIFIEKPPGEPGGEMDMSKDQLAAIHTPVLYLLGGPSDIAYANGTDDFAKIAKAPAMLVNIPTGHGGTYNDANGGKGAAIVVDWLQWHLRGDSAAKADFACPDGKWCRDPDVTIERKNGL
ncbi:hypothetical protein GRI89_16930 [Altererythrobacter salegens]|uniref:Alpha/beta hydrolase n=1 Tax=Croceibacterium salegens TaxID=1737568 RepID=A0A6I4SZ31_9SPHN|nr:hypothetical protein [Croceibacterium salegens]MXO61231.1 hypothetical protein [Croceibacterium salegens]